MLSPEERDALYKTLTDQQARKQAEEAARGNRLAAALAEAGGEIGAAIGGQKFDRAQYAGLREAAEQPLTDLEKSRKSATEALQSDIQQQEAQPSAQLGKLYAGLGVPDTGGLTAGQRKQFVSDYLENQKLKAASDAASSAKTDKRDEDKRNRQYSIEKDTLDRTQKVAADPNINLEGVKRAANDIKHAIDKRDKLSSKAAIYSYMSVIAPGMKRNVTGQFEEGEGVLGDLAHKFNMAMDKGLPEEELRNMQRDIADQMTERYKNYLQNVDPIHEANSRVHGIDTRSLDRYSNIPEMIEGFSKQQTKPAASGMGYEEYKRARAKQGKMQ